MECFLPSSSPLQLSRQESAPNAKLHILCRVKELLWKLLLALPLHEVKTEVLNIVQPVERIECATIHEDFCCSPAGSDDASRIVGKLKFLEFVFAQIGEVGRANAGKERIYLEAKMNVEAGYDRGEGYHLDK